jgi:hypothetical protein
MKGEKMETSDKLVRYGRVLNVVGKILAAVCLVGAASALTATFVALALPERLANEIIGSMEITSSIGIFKAGATLGDLIPQAAFFGLKLALVFFALGAFFYCAIAAAVLFIISSIFNSTAAKRSPFLAENVRRLKVIGIILIVASLLLGLQSLIFAFCILALAYVFQYGMELQQQADETL